MPHSRPTNVRISVTSGMSGHFAVMLGDYTEPNLGTYTDCIQSGIGRYSTKAEAEEEARDWAEAEELPLEILPPSAQGAPPCPPTGK